MSVETIIDRLGGIPEVAKRFRLSEKAVWQWNNRGRVPGKWHLPILRLARDQGIEITEDDLLDAAPYAENSPEEAA